MTNLHEKLKNIKTQFEEKIKKARDLNALEDLRVQFLGRKSELTDVLRSLKDLSIEEKKIIGHSANVLKNEIEKQLGIKRESFGVSSQLFSEKERIDISAPLKKTIRGHLHPLTLIRRKIDDFFQSMGFEIVEGPEIETEYYNFDALNIPADHPAREMQDTFWLRNSQKVSSSKLKAQSSRLLMRTQTSSVQIRYMEKNKPPIRIISSGRVFRFEATDQTHDIQFHQVEGLMIGKDISLANLKGVLEALFQHLFGSSVEVRFRPSYFPFVEPGVEVDMKFRGKWMEIAGAGMAHPKVLENVGINSNAWQGFAFGVGLERLAMIKYGIDDIRLFSSGDLRFLRQF